MAGALAQLDGLRVLEDAVDLLRRTPLAALAWHFAGSVPLASGAVLFFIDAANGRPSDARLAGGALAVAVLLAWMNCCRAVFAAHLRCQLSGRALPRWTGAAVWRLAVNQTFLGATKLVAFPVAVCSLLPLGFAVAFFRGAAAVAVSSDADLFALCARAARLARFRQRRNWVVIALLVLLFPFAFLNLALVLAALPQMIRMLTGYESVFSRSGAYFVWNPVFLCFALAASWVFFDPLVQAAYCVCSFEADSEETGEDLLVALRRVRGATAAIAAAVFLAGAGLALSAPPLRAEEALSPRDLAHAVRQSAQAPEYDWSRLPPPRPHAGDPWLVRVTKRFWDACQGVFDAIGDALRRFFRWLFEIKRPPLTGKGTPPRQGAISFGVYLLIALTVVAAGFVAWRLRKARAYPAEAVAPRAAEIATPPGDSHDLNPLALPEQEWFALADRYLREEQWRLAVRALYLANLAWLGRRQFIRIHAGKTNRQYEREFGRKITHAPAVQGLFAANLRVFESAWYGMHELQAGDAIRFRAAIEEMMAGLEGMA